MLVTKCSRSGVVRIEAIAGSHGADTLTGDSGDNSLFGRIGNDSISALGGNDFLDGGIETDELDGGLDIDECRNGENLLDNCEFHSSAGPSPREMFRAVRVVSRLEQRMATAHRSSW